MKQYETFIFDSYTFDPKEGKIELKYSLDDEMHFTETVTLQRDGLFPSGVDLELLDRALFALHLIGGISYYKTCCPKKMEIRSGKLTKEQAEFWNTVYEKGLGEFFYRNNLDPEGLISFPADAQDAPEPIEVQKFHDRVLVPIGGGKDSIVTLEMLRACRMDCTLFRLGEHPLINETAEVAKLPLISVKRQLPSVLFQLNEEGALNGHVPITAYLSFLSVIAALLYGFDFIAMSAERSASEGNVEYKGKMINHQWSKSLEFERMFQKYVHRFLTPGIDCFSLLRSMSELHIAQHFCTLPQYFRCATSCNKNWRILEEKPKERWCGTCPKCAFSFCQFAAFLPKKQLLEIFGKNLYQDESLLPLYRQLLGLTGFKPFECVGTPEETAAAMLLAVQQGELEETPVMQMFLLEKAESITDIPKLIRSVLEPSSEHAVSARFLMRLDAHT
ncbi:hypothetical protein A2454_05965 [Candidatus Peribacteria bacterium RIFOXYC2_FULL_55_14]|nr:MAG: hypothetical protein A2198_03600 [Candidatus Peribacteria bacterium RIFOXYA1_FULL_56_14]OGJ72709.1 MAG: hypothetical protein A2217_04460 [Candidatus Peribacteria bacterium RIFOXYA2_FULL_55_28]OGJ75386.1 MAG: hypothetical protein A2384_00595 [Candidatus Peribacteria bacterium RIFOXYB1_FULL_54_35]OGJ76437.1 MAG: hypothetical protein A2327_01275 [Candidatus Peribacteria bacterium RIFOXYB2_FULL_54_17]OGJ79454.1 MAG: hypothetical protein A2424_01505 [Candidatus Peribacteria bacterium RIFOXYC